MTLKIRSKSQKSNQFFILPQRYNTYSSSENHLFDSRDNMWKPYFGQHLTFQSTDVMKSTLSTLQTINLRKFGQNQVTGSEDCVRKRLIFTGL